MNRHSRRATRVEDTKARLLEAVRRAVPNATVQDVRELSGTARPRYHTQAYEWVKYGYEFPTAARDIYSWRLTDHQQCHDALRDGRLTTQPAYFTGTNAYQYTSHANTSATMISQPQQQIFLPTAHEQVSHGNTSITMTPQSQQPMAPPPKTFASMLAMKCASDKNLCDLLEAISTGAASADQINAFHVMSNEIKSNLAKADTAPLATREKASDKTSSENIVPESPNRERSTGFVTPSHANLLQQVAISALRVTDAIEANRSVSQQAIEHPLNVTSSFNPGSAAASSAAVYPFDRITTIDTINNSISLNKYETQVLSAAFQSMTSKATIDFTQMAVLLGHTDLFATDTAYAKLMTKLGIPPTSNAFAISNTVPPTLLPSINYLNPDFHSLHPHIIDSTTLKLFLLAQPSPRRYVPLPLRTCPDITSLLGNIVKAFDLEIDTTTIKKLVFTFEHLNEELLLKENLPQSWEEVLRVVSRAPIWKEQGGRLWVGVGVELMSVIGK